MSETEEEWFYESIVRYKNLNMFELEYPVQHVEPSSTNRICVSCSNDKRHQLLELSLPLKLISQVNNTSESILTSNTDLKIKCGTFTDAVVSHMKTMGDERKVVASHVNTNGVILYNLPSDNSDQIENLSDMKWELESPFIGLNGAELILSKNTICPILQIDINTGKLVEKVQLDESFASCEESVSPIYIEPKIVAFCYHSSGRIQLFDSRDCKLLTNINDGVERKDDLWSFTSLYECSEKTANSIQSPCIGMVSNNRILNVYDSRNWNTPCISTKIDVTPPNTAEFQVKFKPINKSWVSVSGFDANVYVYKLVPKPELVFVHDGHRHVEGFTSKTTTSSHLWFPDIDNVIISSADNGTIHSWQFENKKKLYE